MISQSDLVAIRDNIYLERQIKALKQENYIHMRDKTLLQDRILQLEMLDFTQKVGNGGDNLILASDKW